MGNNEDRDRLLLVVPSEQTRRCKLKYKKAKKKLWDFFLAKQTPGQVAKRSSGVLTLRDIQNPPTHVPV